MKTAPPRRPPSQRTSAGQLFFTPWQRFELRNAVRLVAGRLRRAGDPLLFQTASVFKAIEQDLAAGRLKHAEPDWRETLRMAEDLSAARTEGLGTAAVDIWHICAAQILGAEVFWTFDEVQQRLAADCIKRVPRLPTA